MDVQIETFRVEDTKAIARVMLAAFNSVNQGWTDQSSLAYVQEYFAKSANCVAKVDGRIVGFVVADKHSDHLFVDAIGVDPSEMGKGIGKKLWEHTLLYCKQHDVTEIKMIADPTSRAYLWYQKLHFAETGWVEMSLKLS